MNLVQKIEEWLEEEVYEGAEIVEAKDSNDEEVTSDGTDDIIRGRHECAESLLAQIKKWKKELGISYEEEKEIIKCGGCKQTAEIGENFSEKDWTYPWIDVPLCDDCYTEVRVTIADRFDIKDLSRIDL